MRNAYVFVCNCEACQCVEFVQISLEIERRARRDAWNDTCADLIPACVHVCDFSRLLGLEA
jgi:hypothetical protein